MFGHNRSSADQLPYYDYTNTNTNTTEFQMSQDPLLPDAAATFPPPPLFIPPPLEHDSLSALRSEIGYASSGCSSYGGSPPNYTYSPMLMGRSISHKNLELCSPINSYSDSCDTTTSVVRKVLSTGDLEGWNYSAAAASSGHQRSSSPLVNESSIIESMNRASPYSPDEKKERIQRYRSKRNLRNFNKKIKYECRKTLADSRPRIRGRFAKNDEIEKAAPETQWDHATTVDLDDEDDDDNWINFIDAFSANLMP